MARTFFLLTIAMGALATATTSQALASPFTQAPSLGASLPAGTILRSSDTNRFYRMAGGAVLPLTDCKPFGNCKGAIDVGQSTIDQLEQQRAYPRNGTFLRATDTKAIYRIAGGAPFRITRYTPLRGWRGFVNVNQSTVDRLRAFPLDGTLLRAAETKRIYRIAGGAPIKITDCKPLGGCEGAVKVNQDAIDRFDHLRTFPLLGTFLRAAETGRTYRVAKLAAVPVTNCPPAGGCRGIIEVNLLSIARLHINPRDGTFLRLSGTNRTYRIAGGTPLRITNCKPLGGCKDAIRVDRHTIDRLEREHGAPLNGIFLRVAETGYVYEVVGGAPLRIVDFRLLAGWRKSIAVNRSTVDNLRRMRSFPVDKTYLRTADTLRAYTVTGGKLVQINYCATPGCGIRPNIDQNAVDRLLHAESVATRGTVAGDLFILVAVGLALAALTILALKWPLAAVSALLAVFVLTQALWREFDPLLHIEHAYPGRFSGGFTIYSFDVVSTAFLIVAGYGLISRGLRGREQGLIFLLVLLAVAHVARGVLAFDLQGAVNQGRPVMYFLAPLAYAASVPRGWDKRVWRPLALTCLLLIAVAAFFYLRHGFHSSSEIIIRNGTVIASRPVVGAGGLLLVELTAILGVLRWPSRRSGVVLAIIVGIGTFALQLRTIWAIGLTVGVIAFIGWSSNRFRESRMLVARSVVGASVAAALVVLGFLKSNTLLTDIKSATRSSGTLGWRINGWKDLLATHHSPKEIAIGMPAGSPWTRTINGITTDVLPHNYYVELFLRFGLLGIVILLALYFLLWRRRAEIAPQLGLTPMVIGLLLFAQLIYFVSLSPDPIQGLILGILVGVLPPAALWRSRQIAGKEPEVETDRLPDAR